MSGSGADLGGHRRRHLAGTACGLLMGALATAAFMPAFMPAVSAQEFSGAPIATDRAGNGTGDAGPAFDPARAGLAHAGQGAAPLVGPGNAPEPFDINQTRTRRPNPAASAALAMQSPVAETHVGPVPETPAAAPALDAAPAVGQGAPESGTATPAANAPNSATPAASTPPALGSGTPEGAPAAASAPAMSAPATGVPGSIADLLANHAARFAARAGEQQALATFYGARADQPLFIAGTNVSPIGIAALAAFAGAGAEGLNPADYAIPPLAAHPSDADLADYELRIAATALLYARHAQTGRFDPARISKDVDPTLTPPDPLETLSLIATSPNPSVAFASFAPQYDEYRLLKGQLAHLQSQSQARAVHAAIPPGPSVRPGDRDARMSLLRTRLGLARTADESLYDPALVEAVRQFQAGSGQTADGIVGRGTLAALNAGQGNRVADIIANMERWRWLPHKVAPVYVMVNIPEFMVRVVVNEQTVHETRVVVGKPENQTPIMSEDLQYAVFNPAWNVPPGIIKNEMLPKLQADPYALDRQGIDVVRNGRIIDPGSVDWRRGSQGYSFRQAPGERNALGQMKFMFPNKHSVYLHDTPSRSLFSRDYRAFSHGCVRVFEPLKFAEVLFDLGLPGDNWPQQRIAKLIGGNEKYLTLKQRFPVHLVYFTTYVDAGGKLVSREDLYGIDSATKAALGLDGQRRFADRGGLAPAR
ncbi:murein L,D-transpeptidase YcbB/YkuD [Angulomicrobium tetraedrale]|uniref:Murein L,D-transpeptidase YcbB/YkuD n=1 Tax=Ancylobacter tetraedralis TaxID=217068 RepID=A0A839ZCR4_9HYPH|nr:L,D-transpeptidase family protein [Ancylobacter tetraedralis]MBB3772466.1 murein L,D-transpeptidase YcbB/YkuD [Ancylobacter tetraedralis]